ncbi:hypothetical protein ACFYWS_20350 [Streptomyces sp. NPDC002795]|uniref:hypothetical protein n=1 Tax=Streptomyces sp. NPDC002795 TaxID=3364665 RepID=UPI00369D01B4
MYLSVLGGESVTPDTPGLEDLLRAGLAVPHPYDRDHYVAVDPEHSQRQLVDFAYQQLNAATNYLGELPQFMAHLRDHYAHSRSSDSVELLVGKKLVNARIAEQQFAAQRIIRTAQPGPRTAEDLERSRTRDPQALGRGLTMRTLYHSSVRRLSTVGGWAREMAELGGEIRTLSIPFPRIIMFDMQAAFVAVRDKAGSTVPDQSLMIRHALACDFVASIFDLYWESADPWLGGRASSRGGAERANLVTNPTQRAILRQLCLGRPRRVAAKECGISETWLDEQVRVLRKKVGAESRDALIYWWANSPDHNVRP